MSGEPIESVRQGVRAVISDLKSDPQALETAYLSVITFASTAQQVCPLTELIAFQEPSFAVSGGTDLGAALRLLDQCLERDVRKSTPTQKGDWRPMIFLMTDGRPTDEGWEAEADRIKQKKVGNIIACAAGPNADSSLLKRLTEVVVELSSLQPDAMKAFFKWVSSSIKATSQSITQVSGDAGAVNLPPLPPQIQIVP
jgi:uncharacterized protein YegL